MGEQRGRRIGVVGWFPLGWSALLTFVLLGPTLLHRGFALFGDMVFVPDQPWKPAWLGLDGSVPRSVPMDAVVWLSGQVLPGDLVQKTFLAASFLVAGAGAARLVRSRTRTGQAAAITLYLWNPWMLERLAIGQWACIAGAALLPWLVIAGVRWRDGVRRGAPAAVVLLVAAAICAPSMGLLAVGVLTCILLTRPRAAVLAGAVIAAVVANLPWLVPSLLRPGIVASGGQFGDFAARGESPLGLLASTLSLGGIWKSSIVPPERQVVTVVAASVLLTVACVVGVRWSVARLGRRTVAGLSLAAGAALLVTVLPGWAPIGTALGRLSVDVPAVGVLRDSQRYLVPLALLMTVGVAALVDQLVERAARGAGALRAVAGLIAVTPILLLPTFAWGIHDALAPVRYPAEWSQVAALLRTSESRGAGGATVVLPWTGSYRGYAWDRRRAVLDPAPRFFPGEVLIDDRVYLGDDVIASEDPYLRTVGGALGRPDPTAALLRLGVRWVLVEKHNGVVPTVVPPGSVVHDGAGLELIDLGPPSPSPRVRPAAAVVIVGDLVTVGVFLAASSRFRRRRV